METQTIVMVRAGRIECPDHGDREVKPGEARIMCAQCKLFYPYSVSIPPTISEAEQADQERDMREAADAESRARIRSQAIEQQARKLVQQWALLLEIVNNDISVSKLPDLVLWRRFLIHLLAVADAVARLNATIDLK